MFNITWNQQALTTKLDNIQQKYTHRIKYMCNNICCLFVYNRKGGERKKRKETI